MKEFIVLMAFLNALVAMSIDAMLPALGVMAGDLQVARHNDIQLVIGCIFVGMTFGQIFYGPLADAIGRKRAFTTGMVLYITGSLLSWNAQGLEVMLIGRLMQGVGVAAPRIISMAVIRDKFHGREMAYIMSMVMGVFILVPAIAPTIGQGIIHLWGWRAIFLFYIAASIGGYAWFQMRMDETLAPQNRRPFHLRDIIAGYKEAASSRVTLGYTICCGVAFGGILAYLSCAQQIFHELFSAGDKFALYFGMLALSIGAAFFSNSALVQRHGMRNITSKAIQFYIAASMIFAGHTLLAPPSLVVFMLFMAATFFCLGLMFGNMNAMALEPMGHMAGLASGFIGAGSSLVSLILGIAIGQLYNGTLLPLAVGFVVLSVATHVIMRWTESHHPIVKQ